MSGTLTETAATKSINHVGNYLFSQKTCLEKALPGDTVTQAKYNACFPVL